MFLLKKGDTLQLNMKDDEGNTPLGLSVLRGKLNFATTLLLGGGDFKQAIFDKKDSDINLGETKDYWFFRYKKARNSNATQEANANNNA